MPEYLTPEIVGLEFATKRSPKRMVFEFRDREVSANTLLRYEAKAEGLKGDIISLYDSRDYLTFVNPFNPEIMYVSDLDGRYIGSCKRWDIPSRSNTENIYKDYGKVSKLYNKEIARVSSFKGKANIDRMKHNTELLSSFNKEDIASTRDYPKEDISSKTSDRYSQYSITDLIAERQDDE